MKFLLDANVRHAVGIFLQLAGHDVRFIAGTREHGLADHEVLSLAGQEGRIIITNDKDFGELVFRRGYKHKGVILFRLTDESGPSFATRLTNILEVYGETIKNRFLVITDEHIRFRDVTAKR